MPQESHSRYFDELAENMARRYAAAGPPDLEVGQEIPVDHVEVKSAAPTDPQETRLQHAEVHQDPGDRLYIPTEQRTILLSPMTHIKNVLFWWGAMAFPTLLVVIAPQNALLLNLMKVAPIVAAIAFLILGTRVIQKGGDKWKLSHLLAASTAFHFVVAFAVLAFKR